MKRKCRHFDEIFITQWTLRFGNLRWNTSDDNFVKWQHFRFTESNDADSRFARAPFTSNLQGFFFQFLFIMLLYWYDVKKLVRNYSRTSVYDDDFISITHVILGVIVYNRPAVPCRPCRKSVGQWQYSFQLPFKESWKLCCHWVRDLGQRQITENQELS